MGILSDLVVLPAGSEQRILEATVPADAFEGLDVKGFDVMSFSALHAATQGRDEEDLREWDPIAQRGDDGPWVYELPRDLVEHLAQLPPEKHRELEKKWAKLEYRAVNEYQGLLEEIQPLAQRALERGHAMYLWMCL